LRIDADLIRHVLPTATLSSASDTDAIEATASSSVEPVPPHVRVAHTFDQLPVAAQTFALVAQPVACSSRLVGTSAKAIRVFVLT